jgi:hypothetical protein
MDCAFFPHINFSGESNTFVSSLVIFSQFVVHSTLLRSRKLLYLAQLSIIAISTVSIVAITQYLWLQLVWYLGFGPSF